MTATRRHPNSAAIVDAPHAAADGVDEVDGVDDEVDEAEKLARTNVPTSRPAGCPSDGIAGMGGDTEDGMPDGAAVGPVDRVVSLVGSAEPSVVFASLAAWSAAGWCERCTVDIVEGGARYRLAGPISQSRVQRGEPDDPHTLRIPFTTHDNDDLSAHRREPKRVLNPISSNAPSGHGNHTDDHSNVDHSTDDRSGGHLDPETGNDNAEPGGGAAEVIREPYRGVVSFSWSARRPTSEQRLTAFLLVQHAVATVARHRSEDIAHAASVKAANLQVALQNSRHIGAAIGILMSLHKITAEQAFDLLRVGSQHCHRKLRDLAVEVVETGWLDPALLPGTATHPATRG